MIKGFGQFKVEDYPQEGLRSLVTKFDYFSDAASVEEYFADHYEREYDARSNSEAASHAGLLWQAQEKKALLDKKIEDLKLTLSIAPQYGLGQSPTVAAAQPGLGASVGSPQLSNSVLRNAYLNKTRWTIWMLRTSAIILPLATLICITCLTVRLVWDSIQMASPDASDIQMREHAASDLLADPAAPLPSQKSALSRDTAPDFIEKLRDPGTTIPIIVAFGMITLFGLIHGGEHLILHSVKNVNTGINFKEWLRRSGTRFILGLSVCVLSLLLFWRLYSVATTTVSDVRLLQSDSNPNMEDYRPRFASIVGRHVGTTMFIEVLFGVYVMAIARSFWRQASQLSLAINLVGEHPRCERELGNALEEAAQCRQLIDQIDRYTEQRAKAKRDYGLLNASRFAEICFDLRIKSLEEERAALQRTGAGIEAELNNILSKKAAFTPPPGTPPNNP